MTSIQNQTFNDFEVWIIDGNSQDNTKGFLKNLKKPFLSVSEKDLGVYDAMNKGLKMSKGTWIYFLGADDLLYNNETLEQLHHLFDEKAAVISGSIKYDYNSKDSIFIKRNEGVFKTKWSSRLWINNTVHHQSVFYRKELFAEKMFDLSYQILADYQFNLNLYKKNLKRISIDLIIAKCGTDGMSKNYNWNLYKEEIMFKSKASSIVLLPFFFTIAFLKFVIKKTRSK